MAPASTSVILRGSCGPLGTGEDVPGMSGSYKSVRAGDQVEREPGLRAQTAQLKPRYPDCRMTFEKQPGVSSVSLSTQQKQ